MNILKTRKTHNFIEIFTDDCVLNGTIELCTLHKNGDEESIKNTIENLKEVIEDLESYLIE